MTFFDLDNQIEEAQFNPAVDLATVGESTAAAWEEQRKLNSTFSAQESLFDEYEKLIKEADEAAGGNSQLFNPLKMRALPKAGASKLDWEKKFHEDMDKLRLAHPGLSKSSPEIIRADIAEQREAIRQRSREVRDRSDSLVNDAAAFAATAGAAIVDPPVLLSLGFGAAWATGTLATIGIEAVVGAASESLVQASVQSSRRQFGEQASASEAFASIGAAAVGGGVFAGVLKGGVRGFQHSRRLLNRSKAVPDNLKTHDQRVAEQHVARELEVMDQDPFAAPAVREAISPHTRLSAQADQRAHWLGSTRIPRAVDPTEPLDLKVELFTHIEGQNPSAFVERVRAQAPETFKRMDEIRERAPIVAAKLDNIEKELARPPETAIAAQRETLALKEELKNPDITASRKQQINKEVARISRRQGGNVAAKAAKAIERRRELEAERVALNNEVDSIAFETPQLQMVASRAIRDVQANQLIEIKTAVIEQAIPTLGPTLSKAVLQTYKAAADFVKAIEGRAVEVAPAPRPELPVAPRTVAQGAEEAPAVAEEAVPSATGEPRAPEGAADAAPVAAAADEAAPAAPVVAGAADGAPAAPTGPRELAQLTPEQRTVIDNDIDGGIAKSEGSPPVRTTPEEGSTAAKAQEEVAESQALKELEDNPDMEFEMVTANGELRRMTAREVLDDFADDEAFLRELADCIKGAL